MGLLDGGLVDLGLGPILSMGLECAIFSMIGSILAQIIFSERGSRWDFLNIFIGIIFYLNLDIIQI